jgi:multidrug resistance efflux pump
VELLKERLTYARREAERNKILSNSHAVSSADNERTRTTYRQAEADFQRAESELDQFVNAVRPPDRAAAEAEVRVAEARLEWRQRQLEDTVLRAPCTGQVLEIFKREGDAVRLADNEPVLLFGDLSRLRVRAEIEERFARQVREGQQAVLFGRGLGRETFSGTVALVKQVMGRKTVFSQAPGERKDLSVIEVFIEPEPGFIAAAGLQVDVKVAVAE